MRFSELPEEQQTEVVQAIYAESPDSDIEEIVNALYDQDPEMDSFDTEDINVVATDVNGDGDIDSAAIDADNDGDIDIAAVETDDKAEHDAAMSDLTGDTTPEEELIKGNREGFLDKAKKEKTKGDFSPENKLEKDMLQQATINDNSRMKNIVSALSSFLM